LDPFLDQLDTLFDDVEFVDHGSTDEGPRLVQRRASYRYSLSRLVSSGYPQSEVATVFAHKLIDRGCDFVFLLDCDEFLPFADREDLERFLETHSQFDIIRVPWLNVCPISLSGGDIFSAPFLRAEEPSTEFFKIIIRSSLKKKDPNFVIGQGYHNLVDPAGEVLAAEVSDAACIVHIPIQSYAQLAFKLANGSRRLTREKSKLGLNQGGHWVELAKLLTTAPTKSTDWISIALNYPYATHIAFGRVPLEFSFPYVRSSYNFDHALIADQLAGILQQDDEVEAGDPTSFYVLCDRGEIIAGSLDGSAKDAPAVRGDLRAVLPSNSCDFMGQLVEPLFALPSKLPHTAWAGHVPFMFVLMKMLRPSSYVELGVHNGASLIAAATAARTYNLDCDMYGVDSWQGDEHAGRYEGDAVYDELLRYVSVHFPRVHLVRRFFEEARAGFRNGSVDLLHIDGLHTYEAVRDDFETWFTALDPQGVVIFHDINVFDSGFGVHRYWAELKERFTTIEFLHSFGLGVLFLDPSDPRVAALVALSRSEPGQAFYRDLASMVAGVIHERMGYFGSVDIIRWRDEEISSLKMEIEAMQLTTGEIEMASGDVNRLRVEVSTLEVEASSLHVTLNEVFTSRSWRVTRPLRALRRGTHAK
jgi:hypothetical protein